MKAIELTDKANEDLESIWFYGYSQFGIARADEYIRQMSRRFTQLAEQQTGRRRGELGDDICSLPYASHVIFYLDKPLLIRIIRVLHHSQDVQSHLYWL